MAMDAWDRRPPSIPEALHCTVGGPPSQATCSGVGRRTLCQDWGAGHRYNRILPCVALQNCSLGRKSMAGGCAHQCIRWVCIAGHGTACSRRSARRGCDCGRRSSAPGWPCGAALGKRCGPQVAVTPGCGRRHRTRCADVCGPLDGGSDAFLSNVTEAAHTLTLWCNCDFDVSFFVLSRVYICQFFIFFVSLYLL